MKVNIFIFGIVLTLCTNAYTSEYQRDKVSVKLQSAKEELICTGVILKNNQIEGASILTAKHCLKTSNIFINNQLIKKHILLSNDLAIVKLKNKIPGKYTARITSIYYPDVCSFGYLSNKKFYKCGKLLNTNDTAKVLGQNEIARYLISVDYPIKPGCSGGGMFNPNGDLIGINILTNSKTSLAVNLRYYLSEIYNNI